MISKDELTIITDTISKQYRTVFGDKLKNVYLYGSYARRNYNEWSDIDIAGIVDIKQDEILKYRKNDSVDIRW